MEVGTSTVKKVSIPITATIIRQFKIYMFFYVCSKLRVVNDLLEGIHFVASMEAMYLGVRAGIHPSIIYDIISNAAGSSRLWEFLYSFVFCLNK